MRAAGYVTASIVANPFAGRATGLERGFDYMLEYPIVLRNRTEQADRGTDSAALNKVVFPWLEQHRDEPFFLYAHSTDPHAPYRPPAGYDDEVGESGGDRGVRSQLRALQDRARIRRRHGGEPGRSASAITSIPTAIIQQSIDRYDGEILHNDHSLQLLVEKLKQQGVLNNTLLVIVSDHGEEFWDHGWTAHGHTLYQELTHTRAGDVEPAAVSARRGVFPSRCNSSTSCRRFSNPPARAPAKFMEGQTLLPLARGQAFRRRTPVMTSRFAHPGAQANGPIRENRTDTFALIDPKWKLIYRDKAKSGGDSARRTVRSHQGPAGVEERGGAESGRGGAADVEGRRLDQRAEQAARRSGSRRQE